MCHDERLYSVDHLDIWSGDWVRVEEYICNGVFRCTIWNTGEDGQPENVRNELHMLEDFNFADNY